MMFYIIFHSLSLSIIPTQKVHSYSMEYHCYMYYSFCLSEGKGLFNQPKKIEDGHYICKDCRSILTSYNLPLKHDIFQTLVTAQENMRDMIMDSYIKNHDINEMMAKFYPVDDMPLHPGEHCISKVKAFQTVSKDSIPYTRATDKIAEI